MGYFDHCGWKEHQKPDFSTKIRHPEKKICSQICKFEFFFVPFHPGLGLQPPLAGRPLVGPRPDQPRPGGEKM